MAKKEETPSLISGTLPSLQDTGKPLADVNANLSTLKGQFHPGTLPLFQNVMSSISERVYKARQTSDMDTIGGVMDPTKVSGGTMSGILGWLEGNRGKDISSMYGSTMQGFIKSQEMVSGEIKYLTEMRYNMKNDLNKFKVDLAKNFPGVFNEMSSKDRQELDGGNIPDSLYSKMDNWSKDVYEREMRWEEEDRAMAKAMNELNMEYKQAQTDELKSEIAKKKELAGSFFGDIQGYKDTLAKLRQPKIANEGALPTITSPARPYNTPEELNEIELKIRNKYGKDIEESTMQSAIDSLWYGSEPEVRKKRALTTTTSTFGSQMELEQQQKEDEQEQTVEAMREKYGSVDKWKLLEMVTSDEDIGLLPKGTAEKVLNSIKKSY